MGTSNTFMVGELSWKDSNQYRAWSRGCWSSSGNPCSSCKNVTFTLNSTKYNGSDNYNDVSFGSNHPGGTNFSMSDGAVRFVTDSIDIVVYRNTASRNGGEVKTID